MKFGHFHVEYVLAATVLLRQQIFSAKVRYDRFQKLLTD